MPHSPLPTVSVRRAVMHMRWEDLTFVHWAYEPEVVQRLLPTGLQVETFDGLAYVSLVPFVMRVHLPGRFARVRLPFVGRFAETNVRTYVINENGAQGIWFFSLDASSGLGVLGGRIGYRLPYMWSKMTVDRRPAAIEYRCRRRYPGPRGATSVVDVAIGPELGDDQVSELDHWLSARWRLHSRMFGRLWAAHAVHERWPLRAAELVSYDDELIAAAGLPEPSGTPIVQFAEGVSVRVGRPYRVRRQSTAPVD